MAVSLPRRECLKPGLAAADLQQALHQAGRRPTSKTKLSDTCTSTSPERTQGVGRRPPTTPADSIFMDCARSILPVLQGGDETHQQCSGEGKRPALRRGAHANRFSPGKVHLHAARARGKKQAPGAWRHQYATKRASGGSETGRARGPSVRSCFHRGGARPAPTARRTPHFVASRREGAQQQ